MTAATTQREILSGHNGRVPDVDSPAVRARARGSLTITDSGIKSGDRISRAVSGWWGLHVRPLSTIQAWALSDVDPARIPLNAGPLRVLWRLSNWTDRLIMFAVIQIAPTFTQAPLRWIAVRPSRRWALYLTGAALTTLYLIGRKSS